MAMIGACTICGQPLPTRDEDPLTAGLRAHVDCALERGRQATAARIEADMAREGGQRVAERRTLIELGRRHERASILALLDEAASGAERSAAQWAELMTEEFSVVGEDKRTASLLRALYGRVERGEHIDTEREG